MMGLMERQILGDFYLQKQLGQGPLGQVFLAEHRFLRRQFVLKLLPEELSLDRGFVQRFEKEVSLWASIDHPNYAKVHNISFADGIYFLVTDCVVDEFGQSRPLHHYLNEHPHLSEESIFDLCMQVASALDEIHKKVIDGMALAHRSLKFGNILVSAKSSLDSSVKVVLTDGGLAKMIGEGAIFLRAQKAMADALALSFLPHFRYGDLPESSKTSKLQTSFVQTYAFLSPEQKSGDLKSIDYRSDNYAFGILTYYLLMRSFPEGAFTLPSETGRFHYDWDLLLQKCLAQNAEKRAVHLVDLLQTITNRKTFITPIVELEDVGQILTGRHTVAPVAHHEQSSPVALMEAPSVVAKPKLNPSEIEKPKMEENPASVFHIDSVVAPYKPKAKESVEIEPILTPMSVVQEGEYTRGSTSGARDEKPAHKIFISSFAIDVHPVTNEQYVRFLEAMGGEKDANNNDMIQLKESRVKKMAGKFIIESGYTRHPVVGVSWYGAIAYAKWIGKRLPTEAEWEIASKGGNPEILFPTGAAIERQQANFFSSDTTPVMSYPANGYGLFDMAGNVYEWCQDWYDYNTYENSQQEPMNPKGPLQGVYRVLRGGCWKSLREDLRCSHRHRNNPGTLNRTYGFRCAADVS